MNKLALGTVQLGLPYGIANQGGQIGRKEACSILSLARECGVDTLDTAINYGDSEKCLGDMGVEGFRLITKLPDLPDGITDIAAWVDEQLQASLSRLKVDALYGLLLHRSQQLSSVGGVAIARALERLKADGRVQKIGVSIYRPEELDAATQACAIDLVQAPLNLIDRRLVTSGWLQRLQEQCIEVHVRSTFLQGLLLMPRAAIPAQFERWAPLWDTWHEYLAYNHISAIEACLRYPLSLPQINRVVVGVDSSAQLRELLAVVQSAPNCHADPAIGCNDEDLLNPTRWNSL